MIQSILLPKAAARAEAEGCVSQLVRQLKSIESLLDQYDDWELSNGSKSLSTVDRQGLRDVKSLFEKCQTKVEKLSHNYHFCCGSLSVHLPSQVRKGDDSSELEPLEQLIATVKAHFSAICDRIGKAKELFSAGGDFETLRQSLTKFHTSFIDMSTLYLSAFRDACSKSDERRSRLGSQFYDLGRSIQQSQGKIQSTVVLRPVLPLLGEESAHRFVHVSDPHTIHCYHPSVSGVNPFYLSDVLQDPQDPAGHVLFPEELQLRLQPMLSSVRDGTTGVVITLGPRSSGKSHLLFGSGESNGVMHDVLRELLEMTMESSENRTVQLRCFEIDETGGALDLLKSATAPSQTKPQSRRVALLMDLQSREVYSPSSIGSLASLCRESHHAGRPLVMQIRLQSDKGSMGEVFLLEIPHGYGFVTPGDSLKCLLALLSGEKRSATFFQDFLSEKLNSKSTRVAVLLSLSPGLSCSEESQEYLNFVQKLSPCDRNPNLVVPSESSDAVKQLRRELYQQLHENEQLYQEYTHSLREAAVYKRFVDECQCSLERNRQLEKEEEGRCEAMEVDSVRLLSEQDQYVMDLELKETVLLDEQEKLHQLRDKDARTAISLSLLEDKLVYQKNMKEVERDERRVRELNEKLTEMRAAGAESA